MYLARLQRVAVAKPIWFIWGRGAGCPSSCYRAPTPLPWKIDLANVPAQIQSHGQNTSQNFKLAPCTNNPGISLTSYSYDSSNPLAEGDVGMAGVAVDSVEDMKVLCQHSHDATLFTRSLDTVLRYSTGQDVGVYDNEWCSATSDGHVHCGSRRAG